MDKITEIINEWDPLDLLPFAPQDEYEAEINEIKNILKGNKDISIRELAFSINTILVNFLGDDYVPDMAKCIQVAQKILMQL